MVELIELIFAIELHFALFESEFGLVEATAKGTSNDDRSRLENINTRVERN